MRYKNEREVYYGKETVSDRRAGPGDHPGRAHPVPRLRRKGIRENARRINKAFSWNKGFREYFAVKALPNPIILQILKEEGCGVDCSSLTELMLSEVCGFTGSDIMFSSNQTPVEDMKKAYELGAYINLDDATMVDFLDRVAGIPENIFCRYNPGGTFQLGESEEGFQVMDKPGDAKYGMTEEQMIDSYKKLMAKGAKNFGIHAFLASNTISDAYYPELAGILFQLAVRVQKATGAHIGYINLSGGVGIPYRPDQTENDIMAIGEACAGSLRRSLCPQGWAMWPSSPRWAALPPAPTVRWWQLPSTKSTSTRSTSVWMPALPT